MTKEKRHVKICRWKNTPEGDWETDCGEIHQFMTARHGPDENKHCFCPYCGRIIMELEMEEQ